jgi:hypothetical protein
VKKSKRVASREEVLEFLDDKLSYYGEMKQMYEEGIITCYVSPKGHLIFQNGPPDKTRDWKTK